MAREDLTPFERALYDNPNIHSGPAPVYNDSCYICRDQDFAMMGLPLCTACPICGAHVPADDIICDNGHDGQEFYYSMLPRQDIGDRTPAHGDPWRVIL
jgi:hypothetical protein